MSNPQASDLAEIFQLAQKRAKESSLPYVGALTPNEAFEVLQAIAQSKLVDVRTQAELELVGRVPNALHVEWATFPGMVANPGFAKQLVERLDQDGLDKSRVLIFMCRTGGRSHNAATVAATLGFTQVYNMLEGFEGEANSQKQRTLVNGWKHANLPWTN